MLGGSPTRRAAQISSGPSRRQWRPAPFGSVGSFRDEGELWRTDPRIPSNHATGYIRKGKQRVGMIRIGSVAFFSGNDRFWAAAAAAAGAAAVNLLHGKYLKVRTTDKDFATFTSLEAKILNGMAQRSA